MESVVHVMAVLSFCLSVTLYQHAHQTGFHSQIMANFSGIMRLNIFSMMTKPSAFYLRHLEFFVLPDADH